MLRRLIAPIFLILVIAGVGTMCTAMTGARARRRRLHREPPPVAATTPAPAKGNSAAANASATSVIACPEKLPDTTGWKRVAPEGSPISIFVPPDFVVVPQSAGPDVHAPFLIVRALNGDEYRLTVAAAPIRAADDRDYAGTSSCRIMIGEVIADLETARDSWRGGDHHVVLAAYRLGPLFLTALGTTENLEHERQIVAALHYARFPSP